MYVRSHMGKNNGNLDLVCKKNLCVIFLDFFVENKA